MLLAENNLKKTELKVIQIHIPNYNQIQNKEKEIPKVREIARRWVGKEERVRKKKNALTIYYQLFTIRGYVH